tara:strand:- start:7372 stop:7779 length:408 start_codon:yes stop_codon:yes gene_type:complete
MCFGGGGGRATITQPDYNAYNQQFQLQKDAINRTLDNNTRSIQAELNTALRSKKSVLEELTTSQRSLAENTNAQAMRLAQVIGPPPPEKHADAPVIGAKARGLVGKKGKSALRIGRGSSTKSGAGAGANLNIYST